MYLGDTGHALDAQTIFLQWERPRAQKTGPNFIKCAFRTWVAEADISVEREIL